MTKDIGEVELLKIEEQDILAAEKTQDSAIGRNRHSNRSLGGILIGTGVVLLIVNTFGLLFNFSLGQILWPLWFVLPGLLLMWPAYNMTPDDDRTWAWLAIPGALLTTLGGMFVFMSMFNHFEAWAYAWPLLPISVLWAVLYINRYDQDFGAEHGLRQAIRILFWIMVGFGAFFELMIFHNIFSSVLWPLVLVAGGIYLINRHRRMTATA